MAEDLNWVEQELRRVLTVEAEGILATTASIDEHWLAAVEALLRCRGKIAVLAVGKSGHVGRKIAASLASLGSPAFFVHAAEAAHGDLGMISPNDVVLAISNSGETAELLAVLAAVRAIGCPVVAMTARATSSLARAADVAITLPALPEADPLDLAPTTSSTIALAAGDALAVALARARGFSREQFARFHPGGALGKKARSG